MAVSIMKFVIGFLCGLFISSASAIPSATPSPSTNQDAPSTLTPATALSYLPNDIKQSGEFQALFQEDNSRYERADARSARRWFDEEAGKFEGSGKFRPKEKADYRLKLSLKFMAALGADSKMQCSAESLFMILNFMSITTRKTSNSDAALYAGHIGRMQLNECASRFDKQLSASSRRESEWALDKFFATTLSVPGKQADDKALHRKVASFKLDSMSNLETVCKAARALNRLHRAGVRKFDAYLSKTRTIDCEHQVPDFFERVCNSDQAAESRRLDGGLLLVNSAVALGAKPDAIVSERTLKLNEYKRVCREFPKMKQSIESEMKPVSKDVVEPEIVEKSASDDDDFDSPGDRAYFEDLKRASQEGAQSKAMLLEEDKRTAGGLKFWKKYTQ